MSGIGVKQVEIVIYQYAGWDRVFGFEDESTAAPTDTTGWTGRFRLTTEFGAAPSIDASAVPYTYPGSTTPSGMRVTIPASTTSSLAPLTYPRMVGDLNVVTSVGADPDRALQITARIEPGTGPE